LIEELCDDGFWGEERVEIGQRMLSSADGKA